MKKAFISDCEGPISKNDNAFEMASHFVPHGRQLFTVISRYDDALSGMLKRPGYQAGDTLKLILPFLKAYKVTDRGMQEFSTRSLLLIPGAKETLQYVRSTAQSYIVSTSYEHYVLMLCRAVDFPYENAYCTKLSIDKYDIDDEEKATLKEFLKEIVQMPLIEIARKAKVLTDLSDGDQLAIRRLDEIFWEELSRMSCGRMLNEVNPVGGEEKAEAVEDVAQKLDLELADIIYVGDSITDKEAFDLVRRNGGLTLSFNGNQYAIGSAEIAILSENDMVLAVLAEVFARFGKERTRALVDHWSREELLKTSINRSLLNRFLQVHQNKLPKVRMITTKNMTALEKESCTFRKIVRGEAIGGLG